MLLYRMESFENEAQMVKCGSPQKGVFSAVKEHEPI